jgi:ORF6N domain
VAAGISLELKTSDLSNNLFMKNLPALHPNIASRILALREQRVMLDAELAALYGVETKVLVQAIKRNLERFPADFMFQLNADEYAALRSQFVTSNVGRGGRRYAPYAFTEQGVAMLSSVLNSPRAIAINIEIMRAFVQVRATLATHQDLAKQLSELQDKTESLAMSHETFSRNTRNQLKQVFDTLRELMTPPEPHKRPIGFVHSEDAAKTKAEPKPEPKAMKAGKPGKANAAKKVVRKK